MNPKLWKAASCLVLVLLLLPGSASAQVTTATLYGRVLDQSGAAVPNATVNAKEINTSFTKSTTTNERGEFALTFLPVGTYTVTIQAAGFRTATQTDLSLSANESVTLSYTLQVGATAETVTVTAEAPLLNAVNAQQNVALNTTQVNELPLARRDLTNLLNLGTGISAGGGNISLNGLPPKGFTFTVDGVDASPDAEAPSFSLYQDFNFIKGVSLDAVQEVNVVKNIFSAEIAHTVSGNVNLITKSGTNNWHGSLFEFYQSGGLNAVNHLTSTKTSTVYHQFGGSVGGPIIRERLFFFSTYEGYRLRQRSPLSGTVPSRYARDVIGRALPGSEDYFNLFPLPNQPETPGSFTSRWIGNGTEERNDNHGSIRADLNLSPNNHLIGRYTRGVPDRLTPRVALGNWRIWDGLNENVSAAFTRVWSPTTTSETRFGYNRSSVDRTDGSFAARVVGLSGLGLPGTGGETFIKWGSTTTVEHTFSNTRGRHSLKYGGLLRWHRARRINEETPEFEFSTLADVMANRPTAAAFQFRLQPFEIRRWFGGVFVQDDIRINPRFILNAGLRYDYSEVPNERDDRLFNRNGPFGPLRDPDSVWNTYYGMISPRLGFAWTVDEAAKTVVRSGFGVFFIPFNIFSGPIEIVRNSADAPVDAELSFRELDALGIRYPVWNDVIFPKVQASGVNSDTVVDPNWENSYSMQWTLNVQRQLTNTLAWEVGYVGTRGVKLIYSPLINRLDRVTRQRPDPRFGQFRYYQSNDSSTYHALQTSLRKRFSHNLQFGVNYTYASNMSYFFGDYGCCSATENPQDLDRMDLNRGPTPYHLRHRFMTDFVYELPFAKFGSGNRTAELILGGWQLSGVFESRSGNPLLIYQNVGNSPGQRPDFVGSSHEAAIRDDWHNPLPNGTYRYLDPAAFRTVPVVSGVATRAGTLGRRSIYGPGRVTLDASLAKNFRMSESTRLRFRADFFNALNNKQFGGIGDRSDRASDFGLVTSFGAGRTTQLSVRFEF